MVATYQLYLIHLNLHLVTMFQHQALGMVIKVIKYMQRRFLTILQWTEDRMVNDKALTWEGICKVNQLDALLMPSVMVIKIRCNIFFFQSLSNEASSSFFLSFFGLQIKYNEA